MNSKSFAETPSEKLVDHLKKSRFFLSLNLTAAAVLAGFCIYGLITHKNDIVFFCLIVIPFYFFPVILLGRSKVKIIILELESRKEKQEIPE